MSPLLHKGVDEKGEEGDLKRSGRNSIDEPNEIWRYEGIVNDATS